MMEYTSNKLSKMSGVSARTLRHYDEIGLLKPMRVASSGYRIYGQVEVDILQQILFFKELGFALEDIKVLLSAPNFDREQAFLSHLAELQVKRERLDVLICNVTKSIAAMKGATAMKDKEKFEKEREQWKKNESKTRNKKRRKKDFAPTIVKVVAIVLAAAIVLGFSVMYAGTYGIPERFLPALTVAGRTIRVPEYTLYFQHEFDGHFRQAQQFAGWAALGLAVGHGLDPEEHPWGQRVTGLEDEDGNPREIYWEDFLREQVTESLHNMFALYARARAAGITLTERQQAELDHEMAQLEAMARREVMSVNAFLRRTNRPPGFTERMQRSVMTREHIIRNYIAHLEEEFRAGYSNEELRVAYEEDTTQFDFVDLRVFPFNRETLRAEEDEDAESLAARQEESDRALHVEALAFMAAVTDEASFIAAAQARFDADAEDDDEEPFEAESATLYQRYRKSFFDQNFTRTSEDEDEEPVLFSDWAFDTDRETGDTILFESDDAYYAVIMLRTAYAVELVDFYITGFDVIPPSPNFDEDADETADRLQAIAEAHERAEAFIDRWEEIGGNEQAFQSLLRTQQFSEEDYEWLSMDGAQPGLVERIAPGGTGSTELEDWIFAQGRAANHIGVVPTFGQDGFATAFNVVLISQVHEGEYSWMDEIGAERSEEDFDEYMEELTAQYTAREIGIGMWFSMRTARMLIDNHLLWEQMQREQADN